MRYLCCIFLFTNHALSFFDNWDSIDYEIFIIVDIIGGWHLCQLEVLECKEVMWPAAKVMETHNVEDCGWPFKKVAYECKINLLTGKTHQVLWFTYGIDI